MQPFDRLESEVRSYCRSFPALFTTARGATLTDAEGRTWLDFFAGAGALNYGHNPPEVKAALLDYLASDGITHALDLHTTAKAAFLESLHARVLAPRGLDHKVMFPGPTGTNAVEAALKLARKATGRTEVLSFSNGFHGMTLGALSVTGNRTKRRGAGVPLAFTSAVPFEGELGDGCATCTRGAGERCCTLDVLERALANPSSGTDLPAAVIVEAVQGEGGARAASAAWLREVRAITRRHGVLLILDDIQAGCGRTGDFFSFEEAGIVPDLITLSKSLSGMGLPLAVVLVRPELDVFAPGEHNGTFRGFNPAFVTARAALETWWQGDALSRHVRARSAQARARLEAMATGRRARVTGRGLMLGLRFDDPAVATAASRAAFERGLLIETAGPRDEVVKLLPPLTITEEELAEGLDLLAEALSEVLGDRASRRAADAVVSA